MNFSLNFTEKGYGAPLILLHGNGESSGYFVNQIDRFANEYRVIAVDTRGHGASPRGNKPFTLETFADDLKNLLDSLNIEKANILGFSDGGNIAVIFALKYPERVASLVLNGANLFPSGLKSSFLIPVKVLFAVFSLLSHFSRRAKRRSELLYLMAKQPNIQPERLSGIKCPVLVIAGTQDVIKEKHTKLIAASLPDSSLCFLKGGHSIAKTNSVEFNSTVEKFLNSL
mgnify:FL=1|jgi:pimeloyl-ACP methyl ester carboxylesterase